MTKSEIYLRAAKRLHSVREYYGCCDALFDVSLTPLNYDRAYDTFAEYFKPVGAFSWLYWWADPPKDKEARLLALCLMAAITEDDE